jgi:hypothetical protein
MVDWPGTLSIQRNARRSRFDNLSLASPCHSSFRIDAFEIAHDQQPQITSRRAYLNFMMDEGQERAQASFRDNYVRLAAIKKKFDPTNFLRVN